MHTNYTDDITIESLCKLAHLNRTSLNQAFKGQTGLSPISYLLSYRLKVACDMLAHTNLNLSEIAELAGFKYVTYFIKQFSAKIGRSPTEYRRTHMGEKRIARGSAD
ncbi:MAG: AraC family transcriptional regulator [Clostridiales Family XIII bacterium]|jgi:transcriptional regulator GlxA family with amidase domain|nr:AraC family transcriptional regulator [Clostridiales Family XIII bacterium]